MNCCLFMKAPPRALSLSSRIYPRFCTLCRSLDGLLTQRRAAEKRLVKSTGGNLPAGSAAPKWSGACLGKKCLTKPHFFLSLTSNYHTTCPIICLQDRTTKLLPPFNNSSKGIVSLPIVAALGWQYWHACVGRLRRNKEWESEASVVC